MQKPHFLLDLKHHPLNIITPIPFPIRICYFIRLPDVPSWNITTVRREINGLPQTYIPIGFTKITLNVLPLLFIQHLNRPYDREPNISHKTVNMDLLVLHTYNVSGYELCKQTGVACYLDIHKNVIRQPYRGWRKHCALLYFVSLSFTRYKNYTVCSCLTWIRMNDENGIFYNTKLICHTLYLGSSLC